MYIVVDIGCIECGERSGLVGVFEHKDEADAAAKLTEENQRADWTGQHYSIVFDPQDPQDYSKYSPNYKKEA